MLAELESADGLAMLSQDSAEPGGGGGSDAVQEALSALKLGALPVVYACMLFFEGVSCNLVCEFSTWLAVTHFYLRTLGWTWQRSSIP